MSGRARTIDPGTFDLIEEAAHVLRQAPAASCAAYATGAVPFVLTAVWFVTDLSRGAPAERSLPGTSLVLLAAFFWMKAWQSVAAEHVLARLEERIPASLSPSRWLQLFLRQARVHGLGLVALPLAVALVVPSVWIHAWLHNTSVLEMSAGDRLSRESWTLARLWPRENHFALLSYFVFALAVVLGIALAIFQLPMLAKALLGVENAFTTAGWSLGNTTYLATVFGLAFLVVDPFVRAYYVLRCFYGRAQHTGVDLLVRVRGAFARAATGVALVLVFWCVGMTAASAAEAAGNAPPPGLESRGPAVAPADLDAALERALQSADYDWRLDLADDEEGWLASIARGARWLREQFADFLRWLNGPSRAPRESSDWALAGAGLINILLILVFLGALAALVWLIVRIARGRHEETPAMAAPSVTSLIERDDVTADQLPENEWMRLARELFARGEVRLALRAWFLGSLAGLAQRGFVVLARHKSNRDYERELVRRGQVAAPLAAAYGENRRLFESVWYGQYATAPEELQRFEGNVRILVGGDA